MSMAASDEELERLKARRLAEMQRNIQAKMQKEKSAADAAERAKSGQDAPKTPRDVVVASLGFRGLEVLEGAEAQYPNEARIVIGKLAELIRSGGLAETIDGGQLLALFRMIGMPVRIATTIKIEEDGKFVSLSDRFKSGH